jgi:hypothetical protein
MTFLNPPELAARWRLSTKTLERWRTEGTGPAFLKLHERILYRLCAIEDFEIEQTQGGDALIQQSLS